MNPEYGYCESNKIMAEVDLAAIRNNYNTIKGMLSRGTRLMSVVKADAYGHGAVEVAKSLSDIGADAFAVAHVDEGIMLRRAGVGGLILVLGYTLPESFSLLSEYDISQACGSLDYLEALCGYTKAGGKSVKVHIKLNTGMNRTGFTVYDDGFGDEAKKAAMLLRDNPSVVREGIFSHFACADEEDTSFTHLQAERFVKGVGLLEDYGADFGIKHICNTSGLISFPEYHFGMVRLGLGLYGYSCPKVEGLEPAMSFSGPVIAINNVYLGEGVGYNLTFKAEREMKIATVSAGYADGVRRDLSNKGFFVCRGVKCPIIGRVCMDMTMIDVSALPDVAIGDRAYIFCKEYGADEVAESIGTISYELLCEVGRRVHRV